MASHLFGYVKKIQIEISVTALRLLGHQSFASLSKSVMAEPSQTARTHEA